MTINTTQPIFGVIVREPSCPASITIFRTPNLHEAVAMAERLDRSVITDVVVTDTVVKDQIILEYTCGMLYKTHTHTVSYTS